MAIKRLDDQAAGRSSGWTIKWLDDQVAGRSSGWTIKWLGVLQMQAGSLRYWGERAFRCEGAREWLGVLARAAYDAVLPGGVVLAMAPVSSLAAVRL